MGAGGGEGVRGGAVITAKERREDEGSEEEGTFLGWKRRGAKGFWGWGEAGGLAGAVFNAEIAEGSGGSGEEGFFNAKEAKRAKGKEERDFGLEEGGRKAGWMGSGEAWGGG